MTAITNRITSPREVVKLLTELFGDRLKFNEMRNDVELDGEILLNRDTQQAYFILSEELDVEVTKALAMDAMIRAALKNSYHPVRQYLYGLLGSYEEGLLEPANLDSLVARYLRPTGESKFEELYSVYLRKWLIAFVARQYEPGFKYDHIVTLQVEGGCRKSSFWSALVGGDYITAGFSMPKSGDVTAKVLQTIHQFAAVELTELGKRVSGRLEATDSFKAFVTSVRDDFVPQYGRTSESHKRGFVLCGLINDEANFLSDPTGNRRYQIITVQKAKVDPIDTDQLLAERDSILLAAVLAYKEGELPMLPLELSELADEDNLQYMQEVAMTLEIARFAKQRPYFRGIECWKEVFNGEEKDYERNKGMVGRGIAPIKWIKAGQKEWIEGSRQNVYRCNHELRLEIEDQERAMQFGDGPLF
ncbi:virulence-associated E family protein [Synechococcus sp. A15-24]|uniref:virulence-associated E family protein n=1 Tax=Synechococcus sp. A15-24 TaxID=1050635 RepID=UPI001CA433C9|nr:virulence-associated E family protein [Synechococcus sp. A15-24]